MKKLLLALPIVFILGGCDSSSSDDDNVSAPIAPIIEQTGKIVSLPTKQVDVYPLGEPGLDAFFAKLDRDNEGIILLDVHGNAQTYEPGMIAKFVMATHRYYRKTNDRSVLADGLKHSDWLVDNIFCDEKFGYWQLEAPLDSLVVWESPFKSAMTNGLSIFALTQMLEFTDKKEEYLSTIECALKAYNYDISEGGVSTINDDYIWFEEYAMESRAKVLNGGIFALTGVWAAKEYLDSEFAAQLFDKMVDAIEQRIDIYDYGHTSLYHSSMITGEYVDFGRPVHGQYNEIHALQLQWLYSLTGNQKLLEKAKQFYSYESYELNSVNKNNKPLAKMTDLYKYHSYEVFTNLDEFTVSLKAGHQMKELHLFYYGYHKELPVLLLSNGDELQIAVEASEHRYFQDNNHHTSIGIYKLNDEVKLVDDVSVSFDSYTYSDNYDRNLLRQVEVVTDDNGTFFKEKYNKWATQGNWPTTYSID